MRSIRHTVMACVLAIGTATSAAAQSVELSGTWQVDPDRSDSPWFPPPQRMAPSAIIPSVDAAATAALVAPQVAETMTIARIGDQLTIARSDHVYGPVRTVRLDGVNRALPGGKTVRGFQDGQTIVLEQMTPVTLPGGRSAQARTVERFTRGTDGALHYERRSEHEDSVRTWRFVFRPAAQ